MCMCGGFLEVGAIAALIGYIGKRMHKCKCDCHEEHLHQCKHCSDHKEVEKCVVKDMGSWKLTEYMSYNIKRFNSKKLKYKIIQCILGAVVLVGIGMLAFGIYGMCKEHHHEHTEHCVHK